MKQRFEKFIPVNNPAFLGNEKKYLLDCIDSGWVSSDGVYVKRFEDQMAHYCGREHGVAVSSGSMAIDVTMRALGIQAGDEVIVPSFTIISCISELMRIGAIPVFVDVDPHSWTIDSSEIEALITPRTKGILAVHIYGVAFDTYALEAIADKFGLVLIEDAAEAHGLKVGQRVAGSFGKVSIFSFYANKNVTCGEGGMILCDDLMLAERCRSIRNLCFDPDNRFVHDELGFNGRLTNLQAAVGLAQLERLDKTTERKREIGLYYRNLLADVEQLSFQADQINESQNIYWVVGILIDESAGKSAAEVRVELGRYGVGTRPFFFPLNLQPVVTEDMKDLPDCPVAYDLYRRGLYLPTGIGLSDADIITVSDALKTVLAS